MERKVLAGEEAREQVELLEFLARRMSTDEEYCGFLHR